MPGSPEISGVQAALTEQLGKFGYSVQRELFETSARPLVAVSIAAGAFGWLVLMLAPLLVLDLTGWVVALVGYAALALVVATVVGIAKGYLPSLVAPVEAVNVCGKRGDTSVWLVAHSDSKGQGVSLAGRVLALAALSVGLVVLLACLLVRPFAPLEWWAVIPMVVLVTTGGAALSRKALTNESSGAVDNATGMIAVLVAAEQLRNRSDVGVLITGAEEFAMAGAKAWVGAHPAEGMFINFDGVDARGRYRVMTHAVPSAVGGDRSAVIGNSLVKALAAVGVEAQLANLPPGVLVDGVVLAKAGMAGVSLSRGDWETLKVVHTVRDVPQRVDVGAAVLAGLATARAVNGLLG
jgi:hypothetical protein